MSFPQRPPLLGWRGGGGQVQCFVTRGGTVGLNYGATRNFLPILMTPFVCLHAQALGLLLGTSTHTKSSCSKAVFVNFRDTRTLNQPGQCISCMDFGVMVALFWALTVAGCNVFGATCFAAITRDLWRGLSFCFKADRWRLRNVLLLLSLRLVCGTTPPPALPPFQMQQLISRAVTFFSFVYTSVSSLGLWHIYFLPSAWVYHL